MPKKFRISQMEVTSSASNRSWIRTTNMTSATPDHSVGTTFKNVQVNENWEFVVWPEINSICELDTLTQPQADTLWLEDLKVVVCGTGDSNIDWKTVTLDKVSDLFWWPLITTPVMWWTWTTVINQIYGNGADVTWTYTSDGGSPITDTGFVVYPSGNPTYTIWSPWVIDQSSWGTTSPISMNLNWLSPSTAYCTKPYATNSVGTSYWEEVCFTTLVAIQLFRVGWNQEDYADNFFMYGWVKYLLGRFNSPPNAFTSLDTFGVKKSFNNDFTSFTDTFFNDSNLNSYYTIHTIFQHSNGKFYWFGSSTTTTAFSDVKVYIIRFDSSFVEEARSVWSVNQAAYGWDITEIIEDPLTGNLILSAGGRSWAGYSGKVVIVNPNTLAIITDCQAIGTWGAAVTAVPTALFSQFRTSTTVESIGVKNTVEAAQNTPLVRFTTDLSTGNITAQQQLDYWQRIGERWRKILVPGSTDFFIAFVRHTSWTTFNSGIVVTRFDTNYNPISTWRYDINWANQWDVYGWYCNWTDLFILWLQGTTAVVIQVNATTGAVIDKIWLTGTSWSSSFWGILFEGSEVFLRWQTTQWSPGWTDMLLGRLTLPFLTTGTSTPAWFNVSSPTITHTVLSNPTWIASSLPIASRTRTVAASAPQWPNVAYQGTITTSNWTII